MIKAFFIHRELRRLADWRWKATEIMSPELVKLFRHNSFGPVWAFCRKCVGDSVYGCVSVSWITAHSGCSVHWHKRLKLMSIIPKKDVLGFILDLAAFAMRKKRVFYSKIAFDTWRIAKKALTHLYVRHSFKCACFFRRSLSNTRRFCFSQLWCTFLHTGTYNFLLSCTVCVCMRQIEGSCVDWALKR